MTFQTQNSDQSAKHIMEVPMVFNACSKMSGELILTTDTRIDGKVFGKVESDRNVIIGTAGYVKGFLRANNLVVFGRIEGNFIVSGTTTFHPGSSIFGSLYTKVLDIKVGAVITAHINTYKELNAFDEAQLILAEEMLRTQTNRMNTPAYSKQEILENNNQENEEEPGFLMKEENPERISEETVISSVEALSKSKEQPEELLIAPKRELRKKPFSVHFRRGPESTLLNGLAKEEQAVMSEPYPYRDEIITQEPSLIADISNQPVNDSQPADADPKHHADKTIVEQGGYIFLTTHTAQLNNKIPMQQPIAETEPLTQFEATKVEEQMPAAETTLLSEPTPLPEPIAAAEPVNMPEPITVKDATLTTHQKHGAKAFQKPVVKSALTSSLLEQSFKEEITFSGGEMTKPENQAAVTVHPPENKTNSHPLFTFSELSSLFSRTKNNHGNSAEKLHENLNGKSANKVNSKLNGSSDQGKDPEEILKTNGSEKKSSFLTNSIKEIPDSDYSSLFQ